MFLKFKLSLEVTPQGHKADRIENVSSGAYKEYPYYKFTIIE